MQERHTKITTQSRFAIRVVLHILAVKLSLIEVVVVWIEFALIYYYHLCHHISLCCENDAKYIDEALLTNGGNAAARMNGSSAHGRENIVYRVVIIVTNSS